MRHPHSGRFFAVGDSEHPDRVYYSEPNEVKADERPDLHRRRRAGACAAGCSAMPLAFHKYRPWVYRGLDPEIRDVGADAYRSGHDLESGHSRH